MSDRRRRLATWVLAAVLGIAIVSVGFLAANPSLTTASHTEFYLQGIEDNATNPETVSPGSVNEFTVGISNHEHHSVTYRVIVAVNGTETTEKSIHVPNGEVRNVSIAVTSPPDPGRYRIQFRLYYEDGEKPDLTLWYWVRVRE